MTDAKTKSDDVKIILRGAQHGGEPGDKRTVDSETAANMVAAGTATYA